MAKIRPFAAIRPNPRLASRVAAPPYDVMTEEEARFYAEREPLSFVRVTRPETNFPRGANPRAEEAYRAAATQFAELLAKGVLGSDSAPSFYVYRQQMAGHAQTGVGALASCADYEKGVIRRHELTRPEKERDRLQHIETVGAQTGPALLFHRPDRELRALVERVASAPPDVDFKAEDGVRHTLWRADSRELVRGFEEAFAALPRLYIADGHHRSAAAAALWRKHGRPKNLSGFLAVLFQADELRILPYHRLVRDLSGLSPSEFLDRLGRTLEPLPSTRPGATERGWFRVRVASGWRAYRFPVGGAGRPGDPEALEAALLQRLVLEPLLGVGDLRTDPRIDFVGGLEGEEKVDALVASGEFACGFVLPPVRIEELMAVADAGGLMPPKSTWFEPKLRDGLLVYQWA